MLENWLGGGRHSGGCFRAEQADEDLIELGAKHRTFVCTSDVVDGNRDAVNDRSGIYRRSG